MVVNKEATKLEINTASIPNWNPRIRTKLSPRFIATFIVLSTANVAAFRTNRSSAKGTITIKLQL